MINSVVLRCPSVFVIWQLRKQPNTHHVRANFQCTTTRVRKAECWLPLADSRCKSMGHNDGLWPRAACQSIKHGPLNDSHVSHDYSFCQLRQVSMFPKMLSAVTNLIQLLLSKRRENLWACRTSILSQLQVKNMQCDVYYVTAACSAKHVQYRPDFRGCT